VALVSLGLFALTSGEAAARSSTEIRVVGRLDARVRVRKERDRTTIIGVLTDESGVPVTGSIQLPGSADGNWQSCFARASETRARDSFVVETGGNFCLNGPPLPDSTRLMLRLSADGYRTRDLELGVSARSGTPPRIIEAPELVDPTSTTPLEIRAALDGLASGEPAQLYVECQGRQTLLASSSARASELTFSIAPETLPGPGNCAWLVSAGSMSAPRSVVLQAQATLTSRGWTERAGRARATIQVGLQTRHDKRPLDQGVLEVTRDGRHVLTAALSPRGEAILEFEQAPDGVVEVRLAEAPLYARTAEPLRLEPPRRFGLWHVLQAAGLVALGVWLAQSWRGTERRGRPPLVGVSEAGAREDGAALGRVLDAHTGRPVAARVEVFELRATTRELLQILETGDEGRFSLEPAPGHVRKLRVTADGYATFEGVWSPATPLVRLVARRRAALALLAGWFRGQGSGPVPTPQQIQEAAASSGRRSVEEWARGVARAAYAAEPPSDADLSALAERKPS